MPLLLSNWTKVSSFGSVLFDLARLHLRAAAWALAAGRRELAAINLDQAAGYLRARGEGR